MAHAKSAVLTAADKKAVIADLRAKIKAQKAVLKTARVELKTLGKNLTAKQKEADKQNVALEKLDKELAAIQAG
ncbi:MAG: hypothetical protein LBV29_03115 [Azoarcus sp.]|nr:hypothetical protein [Azoarcus sp.]